MKLYFPDDPIKQEMLDILIRAYRNGDNRNVWMFNEKCHEVDSVGFFELQNILEKATGLKIEEVLK